MEVYGSGMVRRSSLPGDHGPSVLMQNTGVGEVRTMRRIRKIRGQMRPVGDIYVPASLRGILPPCPEQVLLHAGLHEAPADDESDDVVYRLGLGIEGGVRIHYDDPESG